MGFCRSFVIRPIGWVWPESFHTPTQSNTVDASMCVVSLVARIVCSYDGGHLLPILVPFVFLVETWDWWWFCNFDRYTSLHRSRQKIYLYVCCRKTHCQVHTKKMPAPYVGASCYHVIWPAVPSIYLLCSTETMTSGNRHFTFTI